MLLKLVGKGQNKIYLTADLLKIVHRFFETNKIETDHLVVVFDGFFAKKKLIKSNCVFTKIFQIRHDAALFELPRNNQSSHKRGPKRKYGKRLLFKRKSKLKQTIKLNIYGKKHTIHYREYLCKARFLNGQIVKAIYLTFDQFDKIHLIISTDISLSALEIMKRYSFRFNVEHLIDQLKNSFCLKDIWMQNPKAYCRMIYLKLWGFVITQLSVVKNEAVIKIMSKNVCHGELNPMALSLLQQE